MTFKILHTWILIWMRNAATLTISYLLLLLPLLYLVTNTSTTHITSYNNYIILDSFEWNARKYCTCKTNETTSGTFLVVNERRLSNIIIITYHMTKVGENK